MSPALIDMQILLLIAKSRVGQTTSYDLGPEAHGFNDPNNPFRQELNPLATTLRAG
jgi:hypothetical protein